MGALTRARLGPLIGQDGRLLERKVERDSESATLVEGTLRKGTLLIGFERHHRIDRYPIRDGEVQAPTGTLKLPPGIAKGEHRILLSDADITNRTQVQATSTNHYLDVPQLVSLLNQERSNNKLYVSLIASNPTAYRTTASEAISPSRKSPASPTFFPSSL